MGAAALAAELVWVRVLVLHLGSRVYAFAVLLGVYLLGIGLGSLALSRFANRIRSPRRTLAALQLVVALTLTGQVLALGFTGELLMLPPRLVTLPATFAAIQGVVLVVVACLFLPVTLLFGASFPLAVAVGCGTVAPLVGAPLFAIAIGVLVANLAPNLVKQKSLRISDNSKLLLKGGIILLGASLNLGDIVHTGLGSLPLLS